MSADSKANLPTDKHSHCAAFNLRRIPIVFLGIVIGVVAACKLAPRYCAYLIAVFALCILFSALFIRKTKYFSLSICLLIGLLASSVSLCAHGYVNQSRSHTLYDVTISGRITDSSNCDTDGNIICEEYADIYLDSLCIDGKSKSGKLTLSLSAHSSKDLKVGDRVEFIGILYPMEFICDDPSSLRLWRNRVYYSACLKQECDITRISSSLGIAQKIRLRLRDVLDNNTLPDTSDFIYAMTFGDSKYMDSGVKISFSTTGTSHLMAVSGLHIGVISAAIIFLLRKLKLPYFAVTAINTALLLIYCALCSFTPSVMRATLMITIALIGKTLGLRNDLMSTVCFSGFILLSVNPYYLYDLGFLMSFAAVFGIILCGAPIKKFLSKIMPERLSSVLAVSLAANIGLLPVTLKYFGGISLSFIVANFVTVPLATLIFPIYLAFAIPCCIFPVLGVALTYISIPFDLIISAVTTLSKLPQLRFNMSFPTIAFAPYYIMLFILSPYFIKNKLKKYTSAVAIAACAIIFIVSLSSVNPLGYGVTVVKQKQTQYAIIQSDKGSYLAINGTPDEKGLQESRKKMSDAGIFAIDGVIMCYPDADDVSLVQNYSKILGSDKIYVANGYTFYDKILLNVVIGDHIDDNLAIAYLSDGVFSVSTGGIRVLIADSYDKIPYYAYGYDVLICENAGSAKYAERVFSDSALAEGRDDAIGSGKTLWIKRGRMIIRN